MNIFRLPAEMSLLAASCILPAKIWKTRSCAGISGRSQILFAIVFICRYSDLFISFFSVYNTVMKLFLLASSILTVYLIFFKFNATYDRNHDVFRVEFLLIATVLLSLVLNYKFEFMNIRWAFSTYLEAVAIIPQLCLLQKTGVVDPAIVYYIFALASYRVFYIVNWVCRFYWAGILNLIGIVAGSVELGLYAEFLSLYATRVFQNDQNTQAATVAPTADGDNSITTKKLATKKLAAFMRSLVQYCLKFEHFL